MDVSSRAICAVRINPEIETKKIRIFPSANGTHGKKKGQSFVFHTLAARGSLVAKHWILATKDSVALQKVANLDLFDIGGTLPRGRNMSVPLASMTTNDCANHQSLSARKRK